MPISIFRILPAGPAAKSKKNYPRPSGMAFAGYDLQGLYKTVPISVEPAILRRNLAKKVPLTSSEPLESDSLVVWVVCQLKGIPEGE
jgi:hypothetical protein